MFANLMHTYDAELESTVEHSIIMQSESGSVAWEKPATHKCGAGIWKELHANVMMSGGTTCSTGSVGS